MQVNDRSTNTHEHKIMRLHNQCSENIMRNIIN